MTCIVGLVDNGCIYMGGDSAGTAGSSQTIVRDPKVFVNGPFVMGFTTSFRMGQLLHFAFVPPPHDPEDMDVYHYMVTTFVDAVRDCLKAGGYAYKAQDHEVGGTFLVGYCSRLFQISDDYQVAEASDGYDAVGSGKQAALGALYATQGEGPIHRVLTALQAAEHFTASVRGPFTILCRKTQVVNTSIEVVECCEMELDLDRECARESNPDASSSSAA
jgi:hypothetical protein